MEFIFCLFCGDQLEKRMDQATKRLYCDRCKRFHYRNPTVGAAVVLVENKKLLLVKRSGSYEGMWCIPCGHVEWNEDIRMCAQREMMEETGLIVTIGPVLNVHSNFHDMEKQTVGVWFWGRCTGGELQAGSDASEVGYFPINALPESMAFPTDILVCEQVRSCIKNGTIPDF